MTTTTYFLDHEPRPEKPKKDDTRLPQETLIRLSLFELGPDPRKFGPQGPISEITAKFFTIIVPSDSLGLQRDTSIGFAKGGKMTNSLRTLEDLVASVIGLEQNNVFGTRTDGEFYEATRGRHSTGRKRMNSMSTENLKAITPDHARSTADLVLGLDLTTIEKVSFLSEVQFTIQAMQAFLLRLTSEQALPITGILKLLNGCDTNSIKAKLVLLNSLIRQVRTPFGNKNLANTILFNAEHGVIQHFQVGDTSLTDPIMRIILDQTIKSVSEITNASQLRYRHL